MSHRVAVSWIHSLSALKRTNSYVFADFERLDIICLSAEIMILKDPEHGLYYWMARGFIIQIKWL